MYTLALAVFIGLAVATAIDVTYTLVPVLNKVKYINNVDILFPALCIIAVWASNTSILGTWGLGGQEWLDVVGSGLAVVGLTKVTDAVAEYLHQ